MMCAIEAARRGRRTLVVDHAKAPGEKIRISGGGRCNFTNVHATPANFLSQNPGFQISALRRYRPAAFVSMVERHGVAYHEKTLGQLFCDGSARQIIDMLLAEMATHGAALRLETNVGHIARGADGFSVTLNGAVVTCASLVVATGGKSIPKMGATGLGYEIARAFDVPVTATRPALVPLTFEIGLLDRLKPLAGVAVDARVGHGKTRFDEAMLFTHRGLSGPAILQISSYWREGDEIVVDMAPGVDVGQRLKQVKRESGRQKAANALAEILPRRLAQMLCEREGATANLADAPDKLLMALGQAANAWRVKPVGSEGYRTAEVTLGGVDTEALDSRTLQVKSQPGLFFIGEVVDVTGWLGGYNFQWAWASGWCAGQTA